MRFDDNFPKRLASARNAAGLTQANLAAMAETVVRQIAAYEGGEARPRLKTLQKIAAALGTTEEWLTEGLGTAPSSESFSRLRTIKQVPILLDEEIYQYVKTGKVHKGCQMHPVDIDVSDKAFAYIVHGEAMVSNGTVMDKRGRNLSIPDGTIVVVDPDAIFITGSISMISQGGLVRVRKVTMDMGTSLHIQALNASVYPTEIAKYNDLDFIYAVVKLEIYFDNFRYDDEEIREVSYESNYTQAAVRAVEVIKGMQTKNTNEEDIKNRLERIESMLKEIINKK